MGVISLRRRVDPALEVEVFEVKLDEEFLMSSLFTGGEVRLARLGLAELAATDLDVVVGGLGLGYTAHAVLADPRVRSLVVVEALGPVIEWHEQQLLPDTAGLTSDPRTRLVHGDFFAMLNLGTGLDPATPGRQFHAILVDIDHTPRHVLHPTHAGFYTPEGLRWLVRWLLPGGVFALWSDDPPDADFIAVMEQVFDTVHAHVVTFANPLPVGSRPTRCTSPGGPAARNDHAGTFHAVHGVAPVEVRQGNHSGPNTVCGSTAISAPPSLPSGWACVIAAWRRANSAICAGLPGRAPIGAARIAPPLPSDPVPPNDDSAACRHDSPASTVRKIDGGFAP